ncbi:Imm43 family immunity protein [Ruminococcus albus]|uniref:Immunity protein 43 domain-containing protein n=1 Tax=Ruminococcus albus (strain ATCC 27210 / DSM 20455 / JCM 14654 / NCDO 2250 / 7) TaxID=697329 RepID=E6UAC5_RUMA7|nr:hypothetical protein [Ruminococcus albus]ADU22347.1 hypothetical protein Rumal_1849 [Ruminococcus albus 7 = DSM 20455]
MYYFLCDNHNSRNQAIDCANDYDREICDNCGAIHIRYKGIFKFKIMGKLYDYYTYIGMPVISEKFLNILRENGFTGYEVSETAPRRGTVTKIGDPIKEKYYSLTVTGRCGPICDMNGEPFPYCKKCKYKMDSIGLIATGVSFAPDAYDGSDLFAFDSLYNIPIVSEQVKNVLVKSKLTNLRFVPLTEYIYDAKITKEHAIRRIKKGVAYPELIEAWLKYGVLTEQELNEQLDKSND